MDKAVPRKKLIEVALPLDDINEACAREKSIRHGHPSTLHLWWARRPLAAARAVIFAQMVDDPSSHPHLYPTQADQERERERLFEIIRKLALWENTTNEEVLSEARAEISKSWRMTCAANANHPRAKELFNEEQLPSFLDPFAGGGALPLEAQRLGLEAYASDLNPVAVVINKSMIEIPPRFSASQPVNPKTRADDASWSRDWSGARGLAEDVRAYGQWMRLELERRLGGMYPTVEVTPEMARSRPDLQSLVGLRLTVIAWLWARTVRSPNPAFSGVEVPLLSTWMLSTRRGNEAFIEPIVERLTYRLEARVGKPLDQESAERGTKAGRGANFTCIMSGAALSGEYIKSEALAGRMGTKLTAIVADGPKGRVYLSPTPEHEAIAAKASPAWFPEGYLPEDARAFTPYLYGFAKWSDLFTMRQLTTLTTASDLISEVQQRVREDAVASGLPDDGKSLSAGGAGATAYGEAIAVYLGLCVGKLADLNNSFAAWKLDAQCPVHLFARQAVPMVWDFAEANPIGLASGSWESMVKRTADSLIAGWLPKHCRLAHVEQADAAKSRSHGPFVISTDPPYYDNIPYADLSDFFYAWLRPSLKCVYPSLFATVATPKTEELVASQARHGGRDGARRFFMEGMKVALRGLVAESYDEFPVTIYYAFKQSETRSDSSTSSTGWETFLSAVIDAGFAVTGTHPLRSELANRMRGLDSNALASSIVLVCRRRPANLPNCTRREFVATLKAELPQAVRVMQRENIAPSDLAQATIGPGMAVFTRFGKIIDAEGNPLTVRDALAIINEALDEALAQEEGDFDPESRFAIAWFEQYGFEEGDFGTADVLARAKNTAVSGLVDAGIASSRSGKTRLLRPDELDSQWDPVGGSPVTIWEMTHHLVRALDRDGEAAAANLVSRLGADSDIVRELAYRLYVIAERKKRSADALGYNSLVLSWPEILRLSHDGVGKTAQPELFGAR